MRHDHYPETDGSGITAVQRMIARALCVLLTLPHSVHAAAPVAAGTTNTTVTTAPNGVATVNIAAPNASGMSHNQYQSFDVPASGVILNNATGIAPSQLAGYISANPNLNGAAATLILNEVTSPNRSMLQGYIEVHGQQAEVVIANPYGITCSGCGFINTPRATLTTGTPNIVNGNLVGFAVRQGDILIDGAGLDASGVNYVDLLARAVSLQGQVNAKDIGVIAGVNDFNYATRAATLAGGGTGMAPTIAIDSSALGGMYANRIRFLATEAGVGVRMRGDVGASVDDIVLTAAGKIELSNRMSAARDLTVAYTGGAGGNGVETGGLGAASLYAGRDFRLDAGSASLSLGEGVHGADGNVSLLSATEVRLANNAYVGAGDTLTAKFGTVFDNAGTLESTNAMALLGIGAGNRTVTNRSNAAITAYNGNFSIAKDSGATGNIDLVTESGSTLQSAKDVTVDARNLTLAGTVAGNNVSLSASGATTLGGGTVWADTDLALNTGTLTDSVSSGSSLRGAARDFTFSVANGGIDLGGNQSYYAGRNLTGSASSFNIGTGPTASDISAGTGTLALTSTSGGIVVGAHGTLQSDNAILLDAGQHALTLVNGAGVQAVGDITANYLQFNLGGVMVANGNIALRSTNASGDGTTTVDATGALQAGGTLSIKGYGATPNRAMNIYVNAGGQVYGDSFDIYAKNLDVGASSASVYGLVQGGANGGTVDLDTLTLNSPYSKLFLNTDSAATTTLNLSNPLLNHGLIYGVGNVILNLNGGMTNYAGAAISSGGGALNLKVGANRILLNGGTLYAGTNLNVTLANNAIFQNEAPGTVDTGGDFIVDKVSGAANTQFLNYNEIRSGGNISITADIFRNGRSEPAKTTQTFGFNRTWDADASADSGRYVDFDHNGWVCGVAGCGDHWYGSNYPRPSVPGKGYNLLSGPYVAADYTASWTERESYTSALSGAIPAISSNGNITITTSDGRNDGGNISAFGNLSLVGLTGGATFVNHAYALYERTWSSSGRYLWDCTDGTSALCGSAASYLVNQRDDRRTGVYSEGAGAWTEVAGSRRDAVLRSTAGNAIITINLTQEGTQAMSTTTTVAANANAPSAGIGPATGASAPGSMPSVGGAAINLPNGGNGLFVLNQAPNAQYLIETNPLYGIQSPFLGSDYLAQQLGLTPDQVILRLGDAYYENRLISQQIQAQTGMNLLRTAYSAYDQQVALMDNAVLEAKSLKLSFGTALTADQVAALKHDIVWMEKRVVQGKEVLVPVVYLTDATRAAAKEGGGAQIIAQNVMVKDADTFVNKGGTVQATNALLILARNDVINEGGVLRGDVVGIKSDNGNIINRTRTARVGSAENYDTAVGPIGSIEAGSQLMLDAGKNVNIEGATVTSGGTALIKAGENINVSSLVLESKSTQHTNNSSIWNIDRTSSVETKQTALKAGIAAKDDVTLVADKNVNATGAYIGSEQGQTTLYSKKGDVNVTTLSLTDISTKTSERVGFFTENETNVSNLPQAKKDGKPGPDQSSYTVTESKDSKTKSLLTRIQSSNADGSFKSDSTTTRNADGTETTNTTNRNNAGTNSASNFSGIKVEKSTESSTGTTNAGSTVAGKGVNIIAEGGNVNIHGSSVEADIDGITLMAQKDVNITAAYDTRTQTANSEKHQFGIYSEASADGAFSGMRAKGSMQNTVDTSRTASVSTLDSKGGVNIVAGNRLLNEGTKVNAGGDINVVAKTVDNLAAKDETTHTGTTQTYDVGVAVGVTTNGMGQSLSNIASGGGKQLVIASPESQVKITGGGETRTENSSTSTARVSSFASSGGSVNFQVEGKMTDEGTKLGAAKNIVIDAGSYEMKAAANTINSDVKAVGGSGTITVGVNAQSEVTATLSAEGHNLNETSRGSTAVVGSMTAGGNVVVRTKGDATLEGAKIAAGGGVGIDAGGKLNFKQANDTLSTSSNSTQASANASASVCADLSCASAGVGASGTTAKMETASSKGVAGSIQAGKDGISLKSGGDMSFQGTKIKSAGDTAIDAGGKLDFQALTSTSSAVGSVDGGGGQVGAGVGKSMKVLKDGSLDVQVDFLRDRTNESSTDRVGGSIQTAGKLSIKSGGDARFEGTKVAAATTALNVGGDLLLESAQSTVKVDNSKAGGSLSISGGTQSGSSAHTASGGGGGTAGSKSIGGSFGINTENQSKDNLTNQNASFTSTGKTTLNVGGNATLAGAAIKAGEGVDGTVKGNLTVETRADRVKEEDTKVGFYVGMATTSFGGGKEDSNTPKAAPTRGEKIDNAPGKLSTVGNHLGQTGLYVNVQSEKVDSTSIGERSGLDGGAGGLGGLTVKGNTNLSGASGTTTGINTLGGTTVTAGPQTKHEASQTDFAIKGTVATLLGSDEAKGGSVSSLFKASGNDNALPVKKGSDPVETPKSKVVVGGHRAAGGTDHDVPAPKGLPKVGDIELPGAPKQLAGSVKPLAPNEPPPKLLAKADIDKGGNLDGQSGVKHLSSGDASLPKPLPGKSDATEVSDPGRIAMAPKPKEHAQPGSQAPEPPHSPETVSTAVKTRPTAGEPMPQPAPTDIPVPPPLPKTVALADPLGGKPLKVNALGEDADGRSQFKAPGRNLILKSIAPEYAGESGKMSDALKAKHPEWEAKGGIKYLSPKEQAAHELVVNKDGLLVNKITGVPYSTGTKLDGAIFVIDGKGRIFASTENEQGKFHHSSLTGGEPVAAAGHIMVQDGKLLHLNNDSGHYKPDDVMFRQGIDVLRKKGADTSATRFMEVRPNGTGGVEVFDYAANTVVDFKQWDPRQVDAQRAAEMRIGKPLRDVGSDSSSRRYYETEIDGKKLYLKGMAPEYVGENLNQAHAQTIGKHQDWELKGGVKYLTPKEREAHELSINDQGLLVNKKTGRLFNTADKHDGAIFVVDGNGRIFAGSENEQGKFHHTSLTAGEPVAMAGHMIVRDGKLLHMNNNSGHYQPEAERMYDVLEVLQKHKLDTSEASLMVIRPNPITGQLETYDQKAHKAVDVSVDDPRWAAVNRSLEMRLGKPVMATEVQENGRVVFKTQIDGHDVMLKGMATEHVGEDMNASHAQVVGKHQDWAQQGGVKYLAPAERDAHELVANDKGLLVNKNTGEPFSTGAKAEGAIFVIDGNGHIYASTENEQGKFHHSTFTGGEPVAMAGHIVVQNGRLLHMNNNSGHYMPDQAMFQQGVDILQRKGADIREMNILLIRPKIGGTGTEFWDGHLKRTVDPAVDGHPMANDVERAKAMMAPPPGAIAIPNDF